ncbi:hypothetical protein PENSUB_10718 [Penicillium subrubescens]|jgi:hypothetical protein|uniref:Uncharacterized protein n=1 Tax=Penicillium subrubescens TaxID=1316194 RepID=A0A1Q5T8H8_9EURO|nr:hypothetical protein PENSUB_10718 [Penicillium subrubescens]
MRGSDSPGFSTPLNFIHQTKESATSEVGDEVDLIGGREARGVILVTGSEWIRGIVLVWGGGDSYVLYNGVIVWGK